MHIPLATSDIHAHWGLLLRRSRTLSHHWALGTSLLLWRWSSHLLLLRWPLLHWNLSLWSRLLLHHRLGRSHLLPGVASLPWPTMHSLSALRAPLLLVRSLTHSLLHLLLPNVLLSLDVLLLNGILMEFHLLMIDEFCEILKLPLLSGTILILILVLEVLLFFLKLGVISLAKIKWFDRIRLLFGRYL